VKLSIIAAVADDRVIGRDNDLPWHLPADLKRFKSLTMGHHILMGRKTFQAIGRSLPGRVMVVISRRGLEVPEGVQVARSLEEAVETARQAGEEEAFVVGGGEIYRQSLPHAQRMYLTRVHARFAGDTRFPEFDEFEWRLESKEDREPDDQNAYSYSFLVYERRRI
jgi:dihydrofolate reductase